MIKAKDKTVARVYVPDYDMAYNLRKPERDLYNTVVQVHEWLASYTEPNSEYGFARDLSYWVVRNWKGNRFCGVSHQYDILIGDAARKMQALPLSIATKVERYEDFLLCNTGEMIKVHYRRQIVETNETYRDRLCALLAKRCAIVTKKYVERRDLVVPDALQPIFGSDLTALLLQNDIRKHEHIHYPLTDALSTFWELYGKFACCYYNFDPNTFYDSMYKDYKLQDFINIMLKPGGVADDEAEPEYDMGAYEYEDDADD